jgi:hypothetical protein
MVRVLRQYSLSGCQNEDKCRRSREDGCHFPFFSTKISSRQPVQSLIACMSPSSLQPVRTSSKPTTRVKCGRVNDEFGCHSRQQVDLGQFALGMSD